MNVVLRSADGQHAGVRFADLLGLLAEAAGDDDFAVLGQRLADRVQRFGHRRVDEAAGVDHHHVGVVVGLDDVVALDPELGEDALGIDQRLGAAEADETDFWIGEGHGFLGSASLRGRDPVTSIRNRDGGRKATGCQLPLEWQATDSRRDDAGANYRWRGLESPLEPRSIRPRN